MNENISYEFYTEKNNLENESFNNSIYSALKSSNTLMIVGWSLLIIGVGLILIAIATLIIGVQLIRVQKVKSGILILIFGAFSLGIWPFVVSKKFIKKNEAYYVDYTDIDFQRSLLKGYSRSVVLSWIAVGAFLICCICNLWFVTLAFVPDISKIMFFARLMVVSFIVSIVLAYIAAFFNGVQHIRKNKLAFGYFMICIGMITFGLWPLINSILQKKKIKNDMMLQ